jgi:hypothetical protein
MRPDGYALIASPVVEPLPAASYLQLLYEGGLSADQGGTFEVLDPDGGESTRLGTSQLLQKIALLDDVSFVTWTAHRRDVVCRSQMSGSWWMREIAIGYMADEADRMLESLWRSFVVGGADHFLVVDVDSHAEDTVWPSVFGGDTSSLRGKPDLIAGPDTQLRAIRSSAEGARSLPRHRAALTWGEMAARLTAVP